MILLDYVWKTPQLIDTLKRIESRKLAAYFPTASKTRALRIGLESESLDSAFPHYQAVSNLFVALSLLEVFTLRLARLALEDSKEPVSAKGQGLQRSLNTLSKLGVSTSRQELWPQVNAALKIRHCQMHAGGLLNESRDAGALRQIVRTKAFLQAAHRKSVSNAEAYVVVTSSQHGDQLRISNEYSWIATAYARDYFLALCVEVQTRLASHRLPTPRNGEASTAAV
ncbi:hypothetical protein [Gemmatimonas aurantiaca]|uniref:hypothetical protein n=1 Tax=Gemmatimonas aurantiaca TaxID=173480 RepID=UPI00301C304B